MKAVSLFSNCGAGDLGYRQAGFEFRVLGELDPDRLAVALANHPSAVGVPGDLRVTWKTVVSEWRRREGEGRPDLLAACPPCQGMSSARSGLGRHHDHEAGGRDPRNLLVTVIEAVARELKPRVIVVENVPAFLTRQVPHPATGGPISAALLLVQALSEEYAAFPLVADLADWGVPQTRKRAFLTLIRRDDIASDALGVNAPFPRPTHGTAERDRITITESLRELGAAPLDASSREKATDSSNPMHFVPVWNEDRYRMVAAIKPNSGRGAWVNDECADCGAVTLDRDAATCNSCGHPLPRPVVRDEQGWRLIKGFRNSSYTRMRADAPASTVTTASGRLGSDKTIHPWENRLLSPLECAHLQTFPDEFVWGDALRRWGHTRVREMIGEAVPPRFTRMHGSALLGVLTDSRTEALLPQSDSRVTRASDLLESARRQAGVSTDLSIDSQLQDAPLRSLSGETEPFSAETGLVNH